MSEICKVVFLQNAIELRLVVAAGLKESQLVFFDTTENRQLRQQEDG